MNRFGETLPGSKKKKEIEEASRESKGKQSETEGGWGRCRKTQKKNCFSNIVCAPEVFQEKKNRIEGETGKWRYRLTA